MQSKGSKLSESSQTNVKKVSLLRFQGTLSADMLIEAMSTVSRAAIPAFLNKLRLLFPFSLIFWLTGGLYTHTQAVVREWKPAKRSKHKKARTAPYPSGSDILRDFMTAGRYAKLLRQKK
mmetsp:Transcript_6359/g.16135  ORF Transcript_6359/g.16135 Transcript_6359/m.16135 type:complete len:120 (-) Transcript_6359:297-656(-)